MSERIESVIVVTDRGSQTFTKVGDSAQKMGATIDRAATQSSGSLSRLSRAGAAAGAAFSSLQGTLSLAARANADAEESQAALSAAIEATGHVMEEYSGSLEEASKKGLQLGFDDEDLEDAVAQLIVSTHDAAKAIDDMALAEDIARGRHISLGDAARIVGLAEQGRTGVLRRLGIIIDANATKEEAMAKLQQIYAGQAEAYSKTSAASYDRFRNAVENASEALGSHLGPVQAILIALPGLQAGYVGVGAAVGALAPEMEAATVAAGALDIAMGPVGIAAAALAAVAAIVVFGGALDNEFTPAANKADDALKKLGDTVHYFAEQSSVIAPLAKETFDQLNYIKGAASSYESTLHDLQATQADEAAQLAHLKEAGYEGTQAYKNQEQASNNATKAVRDYILAQEQNEVSSYVLQQAIDGATAVLNDTGPAGDKARQTLQQLDQQVENGQLSWTDYIGKVKDLAKGLDDANIKLIQNANATNTATKANKDYVNTLTGYLQAHKVLGQQYTDLGDNTEQLVTSQRVLHDQLLTLDSDGRKSAETMKAEADASKAAAGAFLDQAKGIGTLDTELEKLIAAGVSTWAERTANRVLAATDALGSGISVIIDGTKSLSSQSQNLNDWAIDLINVAGSYGKIDDLLAHGQITLTTYNRAQQAQADITADNAAVQEDLLRIQAKQAPLLADLADKQAKYIDQLADLPPQQELVALGWMDQNEAAKANAALNLAAAAAAGEYGDAGEKAATKAITAQAQADPAFAAMLEDMGLISVGADGTIKVNFPDAETIQDAVDGLSASIDALTLALGGVPPVVHTDITADYSSLAAGVAGAQAMLSTIDGKTVTTYVNVEFGHVAPGALGYELGGIIPHAQTGIIPRDSRVTMVGEAGPELVRLPGGSMVYPAGASKEMVRSGRGGDIHLHNATINLYPPDQDVYSALRAQLYNGGRG